METQFRQCEIQVQKGQRAVQRGQEAVQRRGAHKSDSKDARLSPRWETSARATLSGHGLWGRGAASWVLFRRAALSRAHHQREGGQGCRSGVCKGEQGPHERNSGRDA